MKQEKRREGAKISESAVVLALTGAGTGTGTGTGAGRWRQGHPRLDDAPSWIRRLDSGLDATPYGNPMPLLRTQAASNPVFPAY